MSDELMERLRALNRVSEIRSLQQIATNRVLAETDPELVTGAMTRLQELGALKERLVIEP